MLARVALVYEAMLDEHGATPNGLGWVDEASMLLYFDQLARILDGDPGPFSVNDLGCGYGALFDYLAARPAFAQGLYLGYDISESMVAAARKRVTDPRARFEQSAVPLAKADYSFVSGAFNIRFGADPQAWDALVRDSLERLAAASIKGFAFNMRSAPEPGEALPEEEDFMFHADPLEYERFCRQRFGSDVRLITGYAPQQWTMLVRLA